jgi:4-hydroxy-tetrahydrodipicolinate synthase
MAEWKGVWPIMPTPLTDDEEVDEEGLRRVINYVIEGGVHGLWMLGSRGEGPNLSPRIHCRVLEVTKDEVRGRVPIITGCAAPGTRQTIENIRLAEEYDVDFVQVTEPYYYAMKNPELAAHYEAVADATKTPLVIYFHDHRYPNVKPGVCPEMIKKLAGHPNVVGMKVVTGDQCILQSLIWETEKITDDFGVMVTDDQQVFAGLLVGCVGTTSPAAAFAPKLYVAMYNAIKKGDLAQGLELQKKAIPLALAIRGFGAPSGKVAMAALGLCGERVSMPLQPMPEPYRQHLIDLMQSGEYR